LKEGPWSLPTQPKHSILSNLIKLKQGNLSSLSHSFRHSTQQGGILKVEGPILAFFPIQ
jgi:hypothetical protein